MQYYIMLLEKKKYTQSFHHPTSLPSKNNNSQGNLHEGSKKCDLKRGAAVNQGYLKNTNTWIILGHKYLAIYGRDAVKGVVMEAGFHGDSIAWGKWMDERKKMVDDWRSNKRMKKWKSKWWKGGGRVLEHENAIKKLRKKIRWK